MSPAHRARQPHPSYKDSEAYRRSNRMRQDGQPTFPLGFSDRPVPVVAQPKRRSRFGIVAALLVCAAVAVVMERRA